MTALDENPSPSLQEVTFRLGYASTGTLRARCRELCDALVAKCLQQREARVEEINLQLRQFITEEPPPSLEEVSKRLGYKHVYALRRSFPDLCLEISKQHKKYLWAIGREKESAKQLKLQELLRISPPISMSDAAKKLGCGVRYLRRRYKDLCRKISKRFLEYSKCRREQDRASMRAEVRCAVSQLIECNIYPSRAKIKEQCSSVSVNSTNWYFKKIVLEAREEFGGR